MTAKRKPAGKLFVLDTNVLMHDPMSLFSFAEHSIYLPMVTMEELDHNKKGMTEVARNARQTSRTLDEIVSGYEGKLEEGFPLAPHCHRTATGKLFLQTGFISSELPSNLPIGKADNQILGVVLHLKKNHPEVEVILVSKDI